MYRLPERLEAPAKDLPDLKKDVLTRAALFEAYIAGISQSYPYEERDTKARPVIRKWLTEMYAPLVDACAQYVCDLREQFRSVVGQDGEGGAIITTQDEIKRIERESMGMVQKVERYCGEKGKVVRWWEESLKTSAGSLWHLKCTVDGIELGDAIRLKKKAAMNIAGWYAAKRLGLAVSGVVMVHVVYVVCADPRLMSI